MVVCVHIPRFELVVAAGGRARSARESLAGRALAIAPQPGAEPRVGEVSASAEAHGIAAGMRLGEALARCPELVLVAADPLGAAREWETALRALEAIGAAPEPARAGLAYFQADGLRGLHGGEPRVLAAASRALSAQARVGAAATRFGALAAALTARPRRPVAVAGGEAGVRRDLAARPVELLRHRDQTAALVEPLRRLGVETLGELRALGRDALADRFGAAGTLAHRLAEGRDDPVRGRLREEPLEESLGLAESSSGPALERVAGLLLDRLLARPERRGRTLRTLLLSARLVERGTWCERVVLRQALSDAARIRLALSTRLALLPAPAEALALAVERFGPPEGEQGTLLQGGSQARAERLREGVAQARALAGPHAALRALLVDPDSRVPERRVVLTPFPL